MKQKEIMTTRQSPSDIQQRTFAFGVRIIKLVDRMPRRLSSEVIARQLLRSGTAVGALMQEADGAETKRDFIHKVGMAYKEARETRHWLATIQAAIMPDDAEVKALWKESDEIVRILFAILGSARKSTQRPAHTNTAF